MPSRTEELTQTLRRSPFYQSVGPMEAGTGWPIPYRKEGHLYLIVPFYGSQYVPDKKQTLLFPPSLTISISWETGKPVEYIDLLYKCPWEPTIMGKPVGSFPHDAIASLTHDSYMELRNALMTHYDELFSHLATNTPIPKATNDEFARLLRLLLEPPLEPFYRALAPRFFDRFLGHATGAKAE